MVIKEMSEISDMIVTEFVAVYTSFTPISENFKIEIKYPYWRIHVKYQGRTVYEDKGKLLYSDKNNIVIIPPGKVCHYKCVEEGNVGHIFFKSEDIGDDIFSVHVQNSEKVLSVFKNILRDQGDRLCVIKCMKGLYSLLEILLHADENRKKSIQQPSDIIHPAIEYIANNLSDTDISNNKLSFLCGVSEPHFRKLFSEQMGIPPMTYVRKRRIEEAKNLIKNDGMDDLLAMAEKVGFKNEYYFSKMFKKYTGVTPKKYAKSKTEVMSWDTAVFKDL